MVVNWWSHRVTYKNALPGIQFEVSWEFNWEQLEKKLNFGRNIKDLNRLTILEQKEHPQGALSASALSAVRFLPHAMQVTKVENRPHNPAP